MEEIWKRDPALLIQLFEHMPYAFALHEMLFNADEIPYDYRFLYVNQPFECCTGLKKDFVIGKTVREVIPDIENFWIETYGKVVKSKKPVSFQNYSIPLQRFYEVTAFCPFDAHFVCIFRDITQYINYEQQLREKNLEKFLNVEKQVYEIINTSHSIISQNKNKIDCLFVANELYKIINICKDIIITMCNKN